MSIVTNLIKRYKALTPKQFMLAGVFALALAAAIGGGFATKQMSSAAEIRDCTTNSIDNQPINGGCGATSPNELLLDIWAKKNPDLEEIYGSFGLSSTDYDRFLKTARFGVADQQGNVVVDGETVMTNAWSIGRNKFSYAKNYWIHDKLYYWSWDTDVLKQNLPVMVLFDDNGTAQFVVMEACGNSVNGVKVTSGAECKDLIKTPVDGKDNTYRFSTDASKFGLAKYLEFNYYVNENDGKGDKLFATTHSPSETVEKTFTKDATVSVKITISLPGKQTKVITSTLCSKKVTVVKKEIASYTCENLVASSSDNITFRFNAIAKHSAGVTVKSADFTLDGSVTTKGVTTDNDKDGNIDRDYTFKDDKSHTVSAIINFVVDGKVVQSKEACKATVTPKKSPVCEFNPNLPPNHPDCKKPECAEKPGSGFPPGDVRCKEKELPHTGPAGTTGLFVGVSALGAAAHRVIMSRRRARRSE